MKLTEKQAVARLRKAVERAGSQSRLADGDGSLQVNISNILTGKRRLTAPKVLDLLDLEVVYSYRKKRRS